MHGKRSGVYEIHFIVSPSTIAGLVMTTDGRYLERSHIYSCVLWPVEMCIDLDFSSYQSEYQIFFCRTSHYTR